MNKRAWLIPMLIVLINALIIMVKWSSLEDSLPAHYDLEGNPNGVMSRSVLLLYPLIGFIICIVAYAIALKKDRFQAGLVILSSGLSLILLSSTLVTLTAGTMPIFMLAEPVILLIAVAGFITTLVKSRKKQAKNIDVV
jgi:hypothetical protein